MYSPVHRREFRERMLELTVWDQARVREEESQFLGEVRTHREQVENIRKHREPDLATIKEQSTEN